MSVSRHQVYTEPDHSILQFIENCFTPTIPQADLAQPWWCQSLWQRYWPGSNWADYKEGKRWGPTGIIMIIYMTPWHTLFTFTWACPFKLINIHDNVRSLKLSKYIIYSLFLVLLPLSLAYGEGDNSSSELRISGLKDLQWVSMTVCRAGREAANRSWLGRGAKHFSILNIICQGRQGGGAYFMNNVMLYLWCY